MRRGFTLRRASFVRTRSIKISAAAGAAVRKVSAVKIAPTHSAALEG